MEFIITLEEGVQISFLKDDFGEQLTIYKGYEAESKFSYLKMELSTGLVSEFVVDCELSFVDV